MTDPAPTAATFFFDPACPWTWVTSRWLVTAAEHRDLTVTWRPYSLLVENGDEIPERYRAGVEASHRALRVVVALDRSVGGDAVARFYTELGHRSFTDGDDAPDLGATLAAAGLDPGHATAADDDGLDEAITASMDEAHRLAGTGSGSPVLAVDGVGHGFFGPVLTAVPDADAAGALWDHLVGLSAIGELHELKRARDGDPTPPPR